MRGGGYEYPVDRIAGIEAYERVSSGVGLALVEASLVAYMQEWLMIIKRMELLIKTSKHLI